MRGRLTLLVVLLAAQAAYCLDSVPMAEYRQRRIKLGADLHGGSAIIFATYEPAMEYQDYRQDEDYYYLTGWNEPGAALIVEDAVPARAGKPALPYREGLLLPERNLRMELFTR